MLLIRMNGEYFTTGDANTAAKKLLEKQNCAVWELKDAPEFEMRNALRQWAEGHKVEQLRIIFEGIHEAFVKHKMSFDVVKVL